MREVHAAADKIDEQEIQKFEKEIKLKHESGAWNMNRLHMIAYDDQN